MFFICFEKKCLCFLVFFNNFNVIILKIKKNLNKNHSNIFLNKKYL